MKWNWYLRMAWRDSRKHFSKLFLFTTAIFVGIASLVAINSFRDNLINDIQNQSKELLGADLVVSNSQPYPDSIKAYLDTLGEDRSFQLSFASMAYFQKTGTGRLLNVKGFQANYPFYGKIVTDPVIPTTTPSLGFDAWVDKSVLLQFDSNIGDSVAIGNFRYKISARLLKVPGRAEIQSAVAPVIYVPLHLIDTLSLVQKGSRITYAYFFKISSVAQLEKAKAQLDKWTASSTISYQTVENRRASTGQILGNLTNFLNMVAFMALLMGCIGVASSVHIYIKEKVNTVAILRCLGASQQDAVMIYFFQLLVMGFLGALLGATLGSLIQLYLPVILADILPVAIHFSVSWKSVGIGLATGVLVTLLFGAIPLLGIRKITPMLVLRQGVAAVGGLDWGIGLVYVLIGLFVYGFTWWQIGNPKSALYFTGYMLVAVVFLYGVAWGMMRLLRKIIPIRWPYILRQSLANLYRPGNQTLVLLLCLGLGSTFIQVLFMIQTILLQQISFTVTDNQPNIVLFDIQKNQKERLAEEAKNFQMPVLQESPIITMRLEAINGRSRAELKKDTLDKVPDWAVEGEYRVTYRSQLANNEKVVKGKWVERVKEGEKILISMDKGFAESLGLGLGDSIDFNVQGAVLRTYIGSIREIEWNRIQSSFTIVFPEGVLEEAPQFYAMALKSPSDTASALLQRSLAKNFANVSVFDLKLLLTTVTDIIKKVEFVIRFMAFISIATGILVFISSIFISRYQRIKESVLLRTLGASRRQVTWIYSLEYFFVGGFASLVAMVLSLGAGWGLTRFVFKTPFYPDVLTMGSIALVISLATTVLGWMNSFGLFSKPPLEVLRNED